MAEGMIRQGSASTRPGAAGKQLLPALPYDHAALEPHIDARTLRLHHGKHHASYVDNLNTALTAYPDLQARTALWLVLNPLKLPQGLRTAIRNNAGGHVNHSLFWDSMSPGGGGAPTGALADAIERDFGSFELFKEQFDQAGARLLGSGWVWLVRAQNKGGKLRVVTTPGHGNPLEQGRSPLLLNDVWEHAYYLKHENRRADYLRDWWQVVNWQEVARRYERFEHSAGRTGDMKIARFPWTRRLF
jgi:superoxide dismutase, Fe-Mn family